MPKKRRRLDKTFEKTILSSNKKIELILAKINDIKDEDIQKEYLAGVGEVINSYQLLSSDYQLKGFTEYSDSNYTNFNQAISKFESEYEI